MSWIRELNSWTEFMSWIRELDSWAEIMSWIRNPESWTEFVSWIRELNSWAEFIIRTMNSVGWTSPMNAEPWILNSEAELHCLKLSSWMRYLNLEWKPWINVLNPSCKSVQLKLMPWIQILNSYSAFARANQYHEPLCWILNPYYERGFRTLNQCAESVPWTRLLNDELRGWNPERCLWTDVWCLKFVLLNQCAELVICI